MMRFLLCANAVASAGTRATAPPRTRSCATPIIAVDVARCSRIVSASARPAVSRYIVWLIAIGWYASSGG